MSTATSQRRARYAVVIKVGEQRVERYILAYGVENAADYYRKRGHTVLSSRKLKRGSHITVSPDAGFRINQLNLRKAQAELGLTWPVEIHQTGRKGSHRGTYQPVLRNGRPAHRIMVKTYLDPTQAGGTLWHELTHAMQAERLARRVGADPGTMRFKNAWSEMDRGVGYNYKSAEIEANRYMERNDDTPLARK